MAGVAGKSGRKGLGIENRSRELKDTLLLAVLEDCKKNPERKLYWAEKFVNRLMAQTVEGSGKYGEFVIVTPIYAGKSKV